LQSGFSLSLCICTRNRPGDLRRCLESVAASVLLPHQVIVSDDGDDDKTVETVATEFPFVQYQRGPRIGLGANRNACIAALTGCYAAFIDDDVLIPPNFVKEGRTIWQKHAGMQPSPIFTGIEIKHTAAGEIQVQPGNADFWGYQRMVPNGAYHAVVINATLFPVELFRSALFDSQLRYGSEEIDMARHATSLGYRILFEPTLRIDHYPSEANRAEYAKLIDASRMYATAKDYWCYQKNPPKAIVFALLAPLKLAASRLAHFDFKGLKDSFAATLTACSYASRAMRRHR